MALLLRDSALADAEAISALHLACWRTNFRGKIDSLALDAIDGREWLERRKLALQNASRVMLVAEEASRVLGFCDGGAPRDCHFSECGELYALYVDPCAQGKGVGKALLLRMKDRLGALGYRTMMVKTLASNPAARAFYAGLGGQERGCSSFSFGGQSYPEVAFLYDLS